jgi:hypothetical protein
VWCGSCAHYQYQAIARTLLVGSYSLMFKASVVATLHVLCAALHACFASSLTVTTAAPRATPPPSTNSPRLLLLFLAVGRVAASALLANVFRC